MFSTMTDIYLMQALTDYYFIKILFKETNRFFLHLL
jgi:hypothetical protein